MCAASNLSDRQADFSAWYNDVITKAELVDQSPTRGCVVLRPYGFAMWEQIKAELDKQIKARGVENAYFPLFIPESFLKKEAEHVEGFSPELAVVTHAGGKKLDEPYVVRPTSETMVYHMFSRWIGSWRDLPLKINQWANVVRWEMRTRPFLRTTEILWQEGHTAHATRDEADTTAQEMRAMYADVIQKHLAIPLFLGRKTPKERFAGADQTYTMEAMMPDGKALQMGTSHLLAQSFPAAYGVQFQSKENKMETPWCTSWGMTTRLVGAALMVHGDDKGVVMPPRIAPYQVVIVPIFRKDEERDAVMQRVEEYKAILAQQGIRVHVDDRTGERPGAKFFKWELKGAPIRMELGPRDVAAGHAVIRTRIETPQFTGKVIVTTAELASVIQAALDEMQDALFARAQSYYAEKTQNAENLESFGAQLRDSNGFYIANWCQSAECEEKLTDYRADIRCILDEAVSGNSSCYACEQPGVSRVVIAKGY